MDYIRYSKDFEGTMKERLLSARQSIEDQYGQHSIICYVSRGTMRGLGINPFDKVGDITIYLDNTLSYGRFLFW